tara:strand:+ start:105614 stop:107464 length:1851 start_codon:yes stop_codon:yes gene_type:complete
LGQDTFIKEIQSNFTGSARLVGTIDGGWLILASDEMQLMKYNQCGDLQWAKDYSISNTNCCVAGQMVTSSNGKIFLLSREKQNGDWAARVTCLTAIGDVVWSKILAKANTDFYPYTLMINPTDDIFIHGNLLSNPGGGNPSIALIKMDEFGLVVWSNVYEDGSVWGSAIVTEDSGFLLRRANSLIKLDSLGALTWYINITSVGTYYYLAPVEVEDGYIFTMYKRGRVQIGYCKIDKLGNLLWGARFTNTTGIPQPLQKVSNGNFVSTFKGPRGLLNIIEFDKDLNVVKGNAINLSLPNTVFYEVNFTSDGFPLFCGKSDSPTSQHLIFGKLDTNYVSGCDTLALTSFSLEPIAKVSGSFTELSLTISGVDSPVTGTDIQFTDAIICSSIKQRKVALGSDTTICMGDTIIVANTTTDQFTTYKWSDGSTDMNLKVTQAGTYWLEASNPCVATVYSDTIMVSADSVTNPNLVTDTIMCGTQPFLLNAEIQGGSYVWQDNSTNPTFTVAQPGKYYVDINQRLCQKRFFSNVLSCEDFLIPNIFTPNSDGVNDYFGVKYEGLEMVTIEVYNRWGTLLFQTSKKGFAWDGTANGEPAPDGVYFYVIQIGKANYQGSITLMR